jgi:hypothetical protein
MTSSQSETEDRGTSPVSGPSKVKSSVVRQLEETRAEVDESNQAGSSNQSSVPTGTAGDSEVESRKGKHAGKPARSVSYADESEGFVTAYEMGAERDVRKKKSKHREHCNPHKEREESGSESEAEEKYQRQRGRKDRREKQQS